MFKFFKWYCFYVDKIDTPNYSGQSTGHWGRFNSVLILLSEVACMFIFKDCLPSSGGHCFILSITLTLAPYKIYLEFDFI